MSNLGNLTNFNRYLMESIDLLSSNENVLKCVTNYNDNPLNTDLPKDLQVEKDVLWKTIYPYSFVPDAQEDQNCFIMVDLDRFRLDEGQAVKTGLLVVDVLCHRNLMKTVNGTRTGILISEIDSIFNGHIMKTGFSKLKFVEGGNWNRMPRLHLGYKLVYEFVDLN